MARRPGATVNSGGYLFVAGGAANGTTVNNGNIQVYAGRATSGTVLNGGTETVFSGSLTPCLQSENMDCKTQTSAYDPLMNVIALRTLRSYWAKPSNAKAAVPLKVWYKAARKAEWTTLVDVKNTFPATDHIAADRLVFDVGGNKWRIVARVDYQARMVFIRWVGDHKAYDKIDAATV